LDLRCASVEPFEVQWYSTTEFAVQDYKRLVPKQFELKITKQLSHLGDYSLISSLLATYHTTATYWGIASLHNVPVSLKIFGTQREHQ
jgi:hypothetical protein